MKILLVRLSSLGDVILATAAVEALAAEAPDARIDVLTKSAFQDVFRTHPAVDRVLEWAPGASVLAMASTIRGEGYARIADLHSNLRTRLLRLAVPRPRWTRYRKGALRRRLAAHLRRPGLLDRTHVVDRYLAALEPVGVSRTRRLPRLYPRAADRERVLSLLAASGWNGKSLLVALAPGARWTTKAWPPESWVELLRRFDYNPPAFPVLIGGPEESRLCADILARAKVQGAALAGQTTVLETAALLRECAALVTNDSAALHMAVAVGTPVVALFGPTVRGFGFYPLGPEDVVLETDLPCRPCTLHGGDRCPEGHHRCLRDIGADSVAEAVGKRLIQVAGG